MLMKMHMRVVEFVLLAAEGQQWAEELMRTLEADNIDSVSNEVLLGDSTRMLEDVRSELFSQTSAEELHEVTVLFYMVSTQ